MNIDLLKYIGIGASLAFAAAVQPGPLQAYLLTRVTSIGWKKTLPAAFAPLLSDGPIALLALLVLGRLSPTMQSVLRAAGGFLLLYLAWSAFKQGRSGHDDSSKKSKRTPGTIFEAALVNLLNPSPYLGWTLIMGPMVMVAWKETPGLGIAVIAAFYVTMIAMLALIIMVFGSARLLSPKLQRCLMLIAVMILVGLGVYQLFISARFFMELV